MLDPLERPKLDINCEGSTKVAAVGTTAGTTAMPGNVTLVSQEMDISGRDWNVEECYRHDQNEQQQHACYLASNQGCARL